MLLRDEKCYSVPEAMGVCICQLTKKTSPLRCLLPLEGSSESLFSRDSTHTYVHKYIGSLRFAHSHNFSAWLFPFRSFSSIPFWCFTCVCVCVSRPLEPSTVLRCSCHEFPADFPPERIWIFFSKRILSARIATEVHFWGWKHGGVPLLTTFER